jgi:predicted DCC family thiol-disulfide oxidoreductase YuxK
MRYCNVLHQISPRQFVDGMTRSSSAVGRIFKRGLRDALYQQRRDARRIWFSCKRNLGI